MTLQPPSRPPQTHMHTHTLYTYEHSNRATINIHYPTSIIRHSFTMCGRRIVCPQRSRTSHRRCHTICSNSYRHRMNVSILIRVCVRVRVVTRVAVRTTHLTTINRTRMRAALNIKSAQMCRQYFPYVWCCRSRSPASTNPIWLKYKCIRTCARTFSKCIVCVGPVCAIHPCAKAHTTHTNALALYEFI